MLFLIYIYVNSKLHLDLSVNSRLMLVRVTAATCSFDGGGVSRVLLSDNLVSTDFYMSARTSVNRRRSHTPNHYSETHASRWNRSETIVSRSERSQQIPSATHYLEIKLLCAPCEPSETIFLLRPLDHGLVATDSGRFKTALTPRCRLAATEGGSLPLFH